MILFKFWYFFKVKIVNTTLRVYVNSFVGEILFSGLEVDEVWYAET